MSVRFSQPLFVQGDKMPIYNPPLGEINAGEVRRYAGLRQSPFNPELIREACWQFPEGTTRYTITIV